MKKGCARLEFGDASFNVSRLDLYATAKVKRLHVTAIHRRAVSLTLNAAIFRGAFESIEILRCENFELIDFKGANTAALKRIVFSNLRIRRIEKHYFRNLRKLERLSVVLNNINKIENYAFKGLGELTTLNISNNNISIIEPSAFVGLYRLMSLDINRNSILELGSRTFSIANAVGSRLTRTIKNINLKKSRLKIIESGSFIFDEMNTIDLSHNRIAVINKNAFDVKSILYLNLEGNRLTAIARNVFHDLNIEIKLILFNNEIVCDCELRWIRNHDEMRTQLRSYENKDIRCGNVELSRYIEDMKCYATIASG